jgi:ribosomal protein S12 methylthiotransferase
VDSERIIIKLKSNYEGADAVVGNTCGFLNSAKEESLAAIAKPWRR